MKTESASPLHPRNQHRGRYDMRALQAAHPALSAWVTLTPAGEESINFSEPEAVIALNQALLKHHYGIQYWQLPPGYLCPPVPGRADYLHFLADLLAEAQGGVVPRDLSLLDIGCGANLIYPLIGQHEYGWKFTGSDVSAEAIKNASAIVQNNPGLSRIIRLRRQKDEQAIFNGVIHKGERYAACICNPPFHDSAAAAKAGTQRKQRNLGLDIKAPLNFGGQDQELWCPGGELAFIARMIDESQAYARNVGWFTTLVSRKEHLPALRDRLKAAEAREVRIVNMAQGQKQSRFIAWRF